MTDLAIRVEGRAGRITLTRPQALNALTFGMIRAIAAALDAWEPDPAVALILIDAQGARAFCAGGDLAEIYATGRRGDFGPGRAFWTAEYRLNARLAAFPKPTVALMQGFVMGGGVGLGCHASARVVGETSRIAMPECGIGLVPDVGGSHLLARAPGALGEYLGLTGHRMDAAEAILAGFADSFVPQAGWPDLAARLTVTGDPAVIAAFARTPPDPAPDARRAEIDDAFTAPGLPTLAARLETSDWGHATLRGLARNCPLSMACALRLIRAARAEPGLVPALTREYRFTHRAASDGDLLEGIRAAVIDKDRAPLWRHSLDRLSAAEVAAMLAPLGPRDWRLTP